MAACDTSTPALHTVSDLPSPAPSGSMAPHLSRGAEGTVVLSWLEPAEDTTALRYAQLESGHWSAPRTVASGTDWFVNWADFPSVSAIDGAFWAAHWLVKRPGGSYAYDVAVAISTDGGGHWNAPQTPHRDGTLTEHGFVSLFPAAGGVGVLWLDGRHMTGDGHHVTQATADNPLEGMTLRSAVIGANEHLHSESLVDDLVCDCCQTDVASMGQGAIAVYRNRDEGEIRDIQVSRFDGHGWGSPTPVSADGWEIAGCPVNGPAIAAVGEQVVVAWYTAADNLPRVNVAFSTDGGQTFSAPLTVDGRMPLGRVDVDWLDAGRAVVSWLADDRGDQAQVQLRSVSLQGDLGLPRTVAITGDGRPSGFPQMVVHEDRLILAWTSTIGDQPVVLTRGLDIDRL